MQQPSTAHPRLFCDWISKGCGTNPTTTGKRNVLMKKYVVTTKHQLIWKWLCSISTKTSQCLAKMSMLGYIQCTGNVRKKYGFSYGKIRPFSAYFRLLYGVRVCTGYCTYLVRTEYVICQYHNFSMVLYLLNETCVRITTDKPLKYPIKVKPSYFPRSQVYPDRNISFSATIGPWPWLFASHHARRHLNYHEL